MFKFFYNFLRNIKSKIRQFFFLHKYRKDTPESTWKFYNQMKYLYRNEFIKRENFSNSIESSEYTKILDHKGFVKININDISKKEEFKNSLNKFRAKFDQINLNYEKDLQKKNYLIQYNFEFNNDAKNLADPFVDVVTKYLGTLPILDSLQMWYSPNESSELSGSRSLHRDPEDFSQFCLIFRV